MWERLKVRDFQSEGRCHAKNYKSEQLSLVPKEVKGNQCFGSDIGKNERKLAIDMKTL